MKKYQKGSLATVAHIFEENRQKAGIFKIPLEMQEAFKEKMKKMVAEAETKLKVEKEVEDDHDEDDPYYNGNGNVPFGYSADGEMD